MWISLIFVLFLSSINKQVLAEDKSLVVDKANTSIRAYLFSELTIKYLVINGSIIDHIEDGALCSSPFESLRLQQNKMPNLSDRYFKWCPSLQELELINNDFSLEKTAFKSLSNLQKLVMRQQKMTRMTKQYFENLHNLQVLEITDCSVKEIDSETFDNLLSLQELTIQGNQIQKINGILTNLVNLRTLKVNEDITYFPWDDLQKLTKLERLNIGYKIRNYDLDKLIEFTPQLKEISLPIYEYCHELDEMKEKLRQNFKDIVFDSPTCIGAGSMISSINKILWIIAIIFVFF